MRCRRRSVYGPHRQVVPLLGCGGAAHAGGVSPALSARVHRPADLQDRRPRRVGAVGIEDECAVIVLVVMGPRAKRAISCPGRRKRLNPCRLGGGGRPSRRSARGERARVLQGGARALQRIEGVDPAEFFRKARNQRVPSRGLGAVGKMRSAIPRPGGPSRLTPACGTRLRCCCRRGRGRKRRNNACGNGVSGQARHYPCPRRPSPPGGRHRPRRGFPP